MTDNPFPKAVAKMELNELHPNIAVANEIHLWCVKGGARQDEQECIPALPKFMFKRSYMVKPSAKEELIKKPPHEMNVVDVYMGHDHKTLENGIRQYADRSLIQDVPGGYIQYEVNELPEVLQIDMKRVDLQGNVTTRQIECPLDIDFAHGGFKELLAPTCQPQKHTLVGVLVGRMRRKTPKDNYIVWWGYVYNHRKDEWHEIAGNAARRVLPTEVYRHLSRHDNAAFALRLWYRRVESAVPLPVRMLLPRMAKHLVDFESPRGCIKIPCSGTMEWVPYDDTTCDGPWGDLPIEYAPLAREVICDPAIGSYGTLYVKLGVSVADMSVPVVMNNNLGFMGDMYILTFFETNYGYQAAPSDAILGDHEDENWPKDLATGKLISQDHPGIPVWAKMGRRGVQGGMPIPDRLLEAVAENLAVFKHYKFNIQKETLLKEWEKLERLVHSSMPHPLALQVMTRVNTSIGAVQHPHVQQDPQMQMANVSGRPVNGHMPTPRSVAGLIALIDAMYKTAKHEAWVCALVEMQVNMSHKQIRDEFEECDFHNPTHTLDDTVREMLRAMIDARMAASMATCAVEPHVPTPPPPVDPAHARERAGAPAASRDEGKNPVDVQHKVCKTAREVAKKAKDAKKAAAAAAAAAEAAKVLEEEERKRRARWAALQAKWDMEEKERQAKLKAPMREMHKRKQEAKEQAKADAEAQRVQQIKEAVALQEREKAAREKAEQEEADRAWLEAQAKREEHGVAKAKATKEKKAYNKNKRKTLAQRQEEEAAAAAAKEQEDNDALVARVQASLEARRAEREAK